MPIIFHEDRYYKSFPPVGWVFSSVVGGCNIRAQCLLGFKVL